MAMILRLVDEVDDTARRMWGTALDGTYRLMVLRWDVADTELVESYTWHVREHPGGDWYAEYRGGKRDEVGRRDYLSMHRMLMGAPPEPGLRLGHFNGNGLDNRRRNLRWMTQEEILAKRRPVGGVSKYKGVAWDGSQAKWVAVFRGKKIGRFRNEEDAARAFDEAAFARWGELAYLNFPRERDVLTSHHATDLLRPVQRE